MRVKVNPYRNNFIEINDNYCVIDFGKYVWIFDKFMVDVESRISREKFNKWKKDGVIKFDIQLEYWNKKKLNRQANVYRFDMERMIKEYVHS